MKNLEYIVNKLKTDTNNTDYTLSYSNNKNVGTATITITGKGNFTGTTTKTFTITQASILGATLANIASVTYTGSARTPAVSMTFNSIALVSGTDYTLSYSNNINAGTANVVITGKGNFAGARSTVFEITPKSISSFSFTLGTTSYTYNGQARTPGVTVKDGSTTLLETSYSLNGEPCTKRELFGTKGGIKIENDFKIYTELEGYLSDITPDMNLIKGNSDMFTNEMAHFVDCALNGTECIAPAKDGVTIMKILDAIYESAKTGHEVLL